MKRHHALLIGLSMAWALMLGTPTLAAQRVPASAIEAAPDARAALRQAGRLPQDKRKPPP